MGWVDKLRNKFKLGRGRAKQKAGAPAAAGVAGGYVAAKGQSERVAGATRQVGEQVKDAGKNVKDAFD
jgi:hypothetical protein